MDFNINSLDELPVTAKMFLDHFGHYKIYAFYAEMGVGKTTFISALLNAMGIEETEGSPTYSLVNVYESPMYGKVFHFDVYRLKSEEEALDIGIEEMFYGGGICLIEWPEKIENLLPENTIRIKIVKNENGSRTLSVEQ